MKLTSFPLDLILLLAEYIEGIDTINLAHTTKLFNSDRTKFVRFNLNRTKSLKYIIDSKFNIEINLLLSRLNFQLKLNLSRCKSITDSSVFLLGNVHTLNLSGCNKITDNVISYLRDIKKVTVIR